MTTSLSLSQSIKNDSVHIHINTFRSIMKESIKHDSLKIRFKELNNNFNNLVSDNKSLLDKFNEIREEKNELLLKKEEYFEELLKSKNSSLFDIGLGFSTGVVFDKNFNPSPGFLIGLNITLLKF